MKISLSSRVYRGTSSKLGKLAKLAPHFPKGLTFHHQKMYDDATTRQHTLYFANSYGFPTQYMNVTRSLDDDDLKGEDVDVSAPMDVASAPMAGDNSAPSAG